jgi:hypothetical protein
MKDLQGFDYATVVNKVASYLLSTTSKTDFLGNMRDDYVSLLAIQAIKACRKFKKDHGGCRKQEARYVYKSLWNYAKCMNRARVRQKNIFFQPLNGELDPQSLEDQVEARDSIKALRERLEPVEWKILERMACADGNTTDAWAENPDDCSRMYFNVKVQRARESAKRILQIE